MAKDLDFSGKTALVTGGRRGLGAAMALALAERGARVVIVARAPEAEKTLATLRATGAAAYYLSCDLSRRSERGNLVERAVGVAGAPIDILINNAGMQFCENAATCTVEEWDYSRSLLLDSYFEVAQQVIPAMKAQRSGKIIHLASICAFREGGGNFSYGVMKSAVVGMTRCMANALGQYNIQVNAIAPGVIRTDLTESCFEPERHRQLLEKYPAGRLGEPEDIAGAMLFLASDLSNFVNGHTLVVDGGFIGN